MKRRTFIRTTASASLAISVLPSCATHSETDTPLVSRMNMFALKGFDNEHEESPLLVSNGKGKMWLFSLRRLTYPQDNELITAFHFDGKNWIESEAVSKTPGHYEAPVSACPMGGQPVVAWTEIKDNKWGITVAQMNANVFDAQHSFFPEKGNSTNPVLIAPQTGKCWLAWENLYQGKFTIQIKKYEQGKWSDTIAVDKGKNSCFDPALAESENGDLYLAYGTNMGFHQNIEMVIIDGQSKEIKETIPIAIGGSRSNRVNINAKPALAFDKDNNLWISYESNRNASRLNDGDNYSGDRSCAILTYKNGKVQELAGEQKWLFEGINDHKPTFIKDNNGDLFLATHCGGDFVDNGWKYRISWLNPGKGWQNPVMLHNAKIKGFLMTPALAFDKNNSIWLATINEKQFKNYEKLKSEEIVNSRLTELNLLQFEAIKIEETKSSFEFTDTQTTGFLPDQKSISTFSGRPKHKRERLKVGNETYTLLYGNLHEHSNSSNCWPAGCDGTLHDNYRFGMYSEGYDFIGMTDHAGSTSEAHWRKNVRTADFYNESESFVALPAVEWTLQSDSKLDYIQHGAGHYNIIFESTEDARKYIRNSHELYCPRTPETANATLLWEILDKKQINCVTIPHHPADKVHPVDWNVNNSKYLTTVELFQCRGNSEYPGCPREKNLERHTPTHYKHAYVDHALKIKKHKLGFVASGDHNNMGVGLAAIWVKEVSRKGILDALKSRRTFATTGDKMFIDFRVNSAFMGETVKGKSSKVDFYVSVQHPIEKVEILRNSKVIQSYTISDINERTIKGSFSDDNYDNTDGVLYYYLRVTQRNKTIGWSSPVWIETI